MGQILHFGNWKKQEKALTLVETVVSLSIILIVSIVTVSISVFSVNSFRISNTKRFFDHEIKNIVELYLTYNEEQFKTTFNKYTNQTITGYVDTTYYLNSVLEYIPSSEGSNFYINLDFETDSLTISAYSNTGTQLSSRSATR